jgi:putative CocE/NonD family hydrolase
MPFELLETMRPQELSPDAEQFMVTMSDGTCLATDVYLPRNPQGASAILVRTPYDKASRYTALKLEALYYTERGYAYVTQDVRGKFRSEGQTLPYQFDVRDAYDTVDWIVAQPWSSGRVGLMGASYYGFTTWAGVASGHPAIRAAIPMVTGIEMGNMHVASEWRRDVPNLLGVNDLVQIWTDNNGYLVDLDLDGRPIADALEEAALALGRSNAVDDLLRRAKTGERYSPYGEGKHPYSSTNIPIRHRASWYDPGLAPYGMADFRHFRADPSRAAQHSLHVAAVDHGGFALADVGRGDERNPYLNDATLVEKLTAETADTLAFFDRHLDGRDDGPPAPAVQWQIGNGPWRASEEWPPAEVQELDLFFASDGGTLGALTDHASADRRGVSWIHDPKSPVRSTTSIEEIWYFAAAFPDERELAQREDVLTFTSDTLEAPVAIAGQPSVTLALATTGPSMHLFATLQDVSPDGTTRPVSHGRTPLVAPDPDSPTRLKLDDIAYRFLTGQRIQLQIKASDYPWYLVHPGTDDNPWLATRFAQTEQTLIVGGRAPSRLTLPGLVD